MNWLKKDWAHYLTRPFDLFGASLWQRWYESKEIKKILGAAMPRVLFVQEGKSMVRSYRSQKQLQTFQNRIVELIKRRPKYVLQLLTEAEEMNEAAKNVLKIGPNYFNNFKAALNFYTQIAVVGMVLPYQIYFLIGEWGLRAPQIKARTKKLRAVSYYPDLYKRIVVPLARRELADKNLLPFLTLKEFLRSDVKAAEKRRQESRAGKRFVYFHDSRVEQITWRKNLDAIVNRLDNTDAAARELSGKIAYRGRARGMARIIASYKKNLRFRKGDILVTVNSNPSLMPYLVKAGGIVAEEGGISSHAAILARELKKPALIGVKGATRAIKNGEMVEINGETGIVRIIK